MVPPDAALRIVGLDQDHQLCPGNHSLHLRKKALALGLLVAAGEAAFFSESHLSGHGWRLLEISIGALYQMARSERPKILLDPLYPIDSVHGIQIPHCRCPTSRRIMIFGPARPVLDAGGE